MSYVIHFHFLNRQRHQSHLQCDWDAAVLDGNTFSKKPIMQLSYERLISVLKSLLPVHLTTTVENNTVFIKDCKNVCGCTCVYVCVCVGGVTPWSVAAFRAA